MAAMNFYKGESISILFTAFDNATPPQMLDISGYTKSVTVFTPYSNYIVPTVTDIGINTFSISLSAADTLSLNPGSFNIVVKLTKDGKVKIGKSVPCYLVNSNVETNPTGQPIDEGHVGVNMTIDSSEINFDMHFGTGDIVIGGSVSYTLDASVDLGGASTSDGKVPTQKAVKTYVDTKAIGMAELDGSGKVLSSQLPSYVDDVLEYSSLVAFPVTGESGKIYIAQNTNLSYRWTGSGYAVISPSIALGETSSTAYRGDRGKIAYDHSQVITGNPHQLGIADLTDGSNVAKLNQANVFTTQGNRISASSGYLELRRTNDSGFAGIKMFNAANEQKWWHAYNSSDYIFYKDASTEIFRLRYDNGNVNAKNGYEVNGTTVIDASRNISAVGGTFSGAFLVNPSTGASGITSISNDSYATIGVKGHQDTGSGWTLLSDFTGKNELAIRKGGVYNALIFRASDQSATFSGNLSATAGNFSGAINTTTQYQLSGSPLFLDPLKSGSAGGVNTVFTGNGSTTAPSWVAGATGTFTSSDGKTVTVTGGVITSII